MGRRANHEGSIYERADGRWCGSIQLGGKRRVLYGKTRQEVVRKLGDLNQAARTGHLVNPSRLTVAEYLAQWLDSHSQELSPGTWSPTTTYYGCASCPNWAPCACRH